MKRLKITFFLQCLITTLIVCKMFEQKLRQLKWGWGQFMKNLYSCWQIVWYNRITVSQLMTSLFHRRPLCNKGFQPFFDCIHSFCCWICLHFKRTQLISGANPWTHLTKWYTQLVFITGEAHVSSSGQKSLGQGVEHMWLCILYHPHSDNILVPKYLLKIAFDWRRRVCVCFG